ncbi:hypothetical protein GF367_04685 [Candidatus Woesearchaeota archaeon]|nr:hypothetical protein [Candidatus Woesearchaeota archaeon]
MRTVLILLSILTLSVALASTAVTLVAVGEATSTVETSMDRAIDVGMQSLHGMVTVDVVPANGSAPRPP